MPPKKAAEEAPSELLKKARFGRVKNNLKMGMVGLPNVGKSSLFNLMTQQSVAAENYPFCTIDPTEARCPVPDQRYKFLCDLYSPPSKVPAMLSVTDIAGLIKGAAEGAGLGNAFLSHIAAVDGIFHLLRAFDNDEVVHVDDSIDPVRDLETINAELCAKDKELCEGALVAALNDLRKSQGCARANEPKGAEPLRAVHAKVMAMLEESTPVGLGEWTSSEVDIIKTHFQLITTKPIVYLVNLTKKDFCRKKNKYLPKIAEWVKTHGGGTVIPLSVEFEQEYFDLREVSAEAQADFLAQCKTEFCNGEGPDISSILPRVIKTGYKELNMINFFTCGDTEVRAWTVYGGSLAPQAAGVIHTDFERGFIKAETVAFRDFKQLCGGKPSMAGVKEAGKYRQEGKTYVVQDGDIFNFQFNVTAKKK
jgi:obg-like ATPase 1